MELEQLRQLDAIATQGTFSAAARALHISQPALSRSMQRLEADLGVELFERTGRRTTLNETGASALDWARQILRDERLMRESLSARSLSRRTLRVATVAPAPLWRLTSHLVERFPEETITSQMLSRDQIMRALATGEAHLGIVPEAPTTPGVESCELMRENLSVLLPPSHPLAARKAVHLAELDGSTFLIRANVGFWRDLVDTALPHSTLIEQEETEVFAQLSRSTPHCLFASDAPFLDSPSAGRAAVQLKDAEAHVVFHLVISTSTEGVARRLFDWVQAQRH